MEDAGVVQGARLFYLPLGLASSLPSDGAARMGEAGDHHSSMAQPEH